LMFETEMYD